MVYFAYGFPCSYRLSGEDGPQEAVSSFWSCNDSEERGCIVVITRTEVQIWNSGQDRYLMGSCRVCERDHACIVAGCVAYVSGKYRVAVLTSDTEVVVLSYEESLTQDQLSWASGLEEFPLTEYNVDVMSREYMENEEDGDDGSAVVGMVGDRTCFCVVYQSGDFVTYDWSGEVINRHSPLEHVNLGLSKSLQGGNTVVHVAYLDKMALLGFVFDDGTVVVMRGKEGLRDMCSGTEQEQAIVYVPNQGRSKGFIASFHPKGQYIAIGTEDSTVVLCDISKFVNSGSIALDEKPTKLSLEAWGYDVIDLGYVSALAWSPDGRAVAVGYILRGMTLWSTRGCQLFSSLPPAYHKHRVSGPFSPRSLQTTYSSKSGVSIQKKSTKGSFDKHVVMEDKDARYSPDGPLDNGATGLFDNGISYISWSKDGGHVLVHEKKSSIMFDVTLAKCCDNHLIHTSHAPTYNDSTKMAAINDSKLSFLICSDRLLLIQEVPAHINSGRKDQPITESLQLSVQHVRVPQQYLDSAYPIASAALNSSGSDIVIAGSHGIGLYSVSTKRWRLIGDVSQDKAIKASYVGWIHDDVILVCASITGGTSKRLPECKAALVFFAKGYLDASSILAFEKMESLPLLMDISNGRISLVFEDGQVQIHQYTIVKGDGRINTVEKVELNLEYSFRIPSHMKAKSLSVMRKGNSDDLWCIILGENGELGYIDIQKGSYSILSHAIDYYWVPHYEIDTSDHDHKSNATFDLPWWTYGKGGMKLWFGSVHIDASKGIDNMDPELEFDAEVLPIGICLQDLSILGLMHRAYRKRHYSNPASSVDFAPLPESQPVLACLLRRLLRSEKFEDALYLADLYSLRPHFPRSMEWLLFTALEANAKQQEEKGLPVEEAGTELMRTAELVSQFPQASELVVSVARKMDAVMWQSLFQAAGSPIAICESLLRDGQLQHASCCLLIISEVVGKTEASRLALKTLKCAIAVSNYSLCVDLLRFLASQDSYNPSSGYKSASINNKMDKNSNYVTWLWNWIAPLQEAELSPEGDNTVHPKEQESLEEEQKLLDKMQFNLSFESGQNIISSAESADPVVEAWRSLAKQAWQLLDSGSVRELALLNKSMTGVYGGLSALFQTTHQLHPCSLGHRTPSASLIANALFISSNEMASASELELESIPGLLESLLRSGNINYAVALAIVANDQHVMNAFVEENRRTWESLQTLISNDVHLCAFSSVLLLANGGSSLGRTMTI